MLIQELFLKPNVVGASETNLPLATMGLSQYASLNLRINAVVSGVAGTCTLKLQGRASGGEFEDLGSANASVVLSDGTNSIRLNKETAADLVDMPLPKDCRLVITTNGSGAVTFNKVTVQLG